MFESSRHVQGLEWLVGEVEASLTEACNALESYIAQDDDVSQLRFCKGHIHQVAGSLKIAECHGGVLLGEQMEALVQGLLDDKIADREAAVEVLLKAFIEVPRYLQNCITNCVDEPSVLISILNDHRALRNESLVSGGSVFNPDLSFLDSLPGRIDAPLANEKVILELIDRLSHVYQYALLDLSKNKEAAVNLNKLLKVLNRLEEVFRGARLEQMWRVAAAVLGGLKTGVVDSGPAVKSLLWGIDSHIRKLAKEGISALDEAFPAVLFKNLLYYLTVAKPSVTSIATIQSDYKLDQALPSGALVHMDDGLIPSYDRSVINALVKSLSEEIELAKAKLNSYLDEGGNPQQTLENVVPVFERIADTLAMVGQSRLRQLVQEISESLTATFSETEFPGAVLSLALANFPVQKKSDRWQHGLSTSTSRSNPGLSIIKKAVLSKTTWQKRPIFLMTRNPRWCGKCAITSKLSKKRSSAIFLPAGTASFYWTFRRCWDISEAR